MAAKIGQVVNMHHGQNLSLDKNFVTDNIKRAPKVSPYLIYGNRRTKNKLS